MAIDPAYLMSLSLTTIPLPNLANEREAHFNRLGEAPELYVELLIQNANAHELRWLGRAAGYCLMTSAGDILELELFQWVWDAKSELFSLLCDHGACSARCYSFDSLLIGLCVERGWRLRVEGHLFRNLTDTEGAADLSGELSLRAATVADSSWIVPHREGVFENDDECREWIDHGNVWALERHGICVGIGLLTRVWPTRPEHDVGVMVLPEHRRSGYASHILRTLKQHCLGQGMRPTAGCALENVASRRALQSAGFASQHTLLTCGQ